MGESTTTLFGKYQLCRELGRGRSGTVYLAKHMELEEYRAIKRVPKASVDYEQFRKEALILKCIRHPGIPIVYDLEETAEYSYMILEFLEGNSLYALVSDRGHFSKAETIQYGIQICHLVNILHSVRPNPILYLDLQPKNLLVCHDVIKLIDFDHSVHLHEAENLTKRYGTVGCAAPEQYTGDILDKRTDIYAIGAVLYYMLTGVYPERSASAGGRAVRLADREMARVIRTCLHTEKEKRYQSVTELADDLERIRIQMQTGERSVWKNSRNLSLIIAAAGAKPGVGTTHAALGLTAYLRRCGMSALYEEKNSSGAARQFALAVGASADRYGIFTIHGIPMLPFYGSAVKLEPHPYTVVVQDYGCDRQTAHAQAADGYVLVCGAKPWEWESTGNALADSADYPGQAVIYNYFCKRLCGRLPGPAGGKGCFLLPYCSDPLAADKQADKVYEHVLRHLTGEKTGGILRGLPGGGKALASRVFQRKTGGQSESSEPDDIPE